MAERKAYRTSSPEGEKLKC